MRGRWMLAIAMLAAACGTKADEADTDGASQLGLDLERVEVDEAMSSALVVLGGGLLARASDRESGDRFRSTDLGDSWERVEGPELDKDIELEGIEVVDGVAVIKGFLPTEPPDSTFDRGNFYVLTSRGGVEWTGGRVSRELTGGIPSLNLSVAYLGDRLVAGFLSENDDFTDSLHLAYSDDNGATWTPASHRDLTVDSEQLLEIGEFGGGTR